MFINNSYQIINCKSIVLISLDSFNIMLIAVLSSFPAAFPIISGFIRIGKKFN